jgi:hypothetical protein
MVKVKKSILSRNERDTPFSESLLNSPTVDEIVKNPQIRFSVIPVETGIQSFQ